MSVATFTKPDIWRYYTNRGAAVLDAVQGVIRGYIFIWGDPDHRDSYGTFVDPARPPMMDLENGMHRRPIKYEHSADGEIQKETIGVIESYGYDDTGVWFEGQLDMSSPYISRILDEIARGELKTSSATMPHTADFYEDGAFMKWTLGEETLTKFPAEPRMPEVVLIRSGEDAEARRDAARVETQADFATHGASAPQDKRIATSTPMEERTMNLQAQIAAILANTDLSEDEKVAQIAALMAPEPEPEPEPEMAMSAANAAPEMPARSLPTAPNGAESELVSMIKDISKRLNGLETTQRAQRQAENAPPPRKTERTGGAGPRVSAVSDLRFDHLGASDALLAAKVLNDYGIPMSEDFTRAVAHKVADAATGGKMFLAETKDTMPVVRHARRLGADGLVSAMGSTYSRANELMATDISGQGQDVVGTYYATVAWDFIRARRIVDALIQRGMMEEVIPAGAKTVVVPTLGADPTIYAANEANDIVDTALLSEATATQSYQGLSSVTVSANELRAVVHRTLRLEETAVINVAAELNKGLQEAFAEAYEYVIVNGDTATDASTNLNLIDGTPASAPSRPKYLVTNGFIKSPLITTTTYARDNGSGALTDNDFLTTTALLPDNVVSNMTEETVYIVDTRTFLAAMKLASVKTADVAGSGATLINGELRAMWGAPLLVSGQMALANTAGKISATPGNNVKGRILVVVPKYWKAFSGRQLTIETGRDVRNSTTIIAAHMVLGVAKRSTDGAAIAYNVAV